MDCNYCVYSLIKYGILPSDIKSYILTNTQKDRLIKNYNRFVIENKESQDLTEIKKCVDIISKENKCHGLDFLEDMKKYSKIQEKINIWKDKCGESGLIEEIEELKELKENEIPYLDIITRAPIESNDVFILNGNCFSKFALREWALTFVDQTRKPKNPLTQVELSLQDIINLELDPNEFKFTYKMEIPEESDQELKDIQSWLNRRSLYYSLNELEKLKKLDLGKAMLTRLPETIGSLISLEELLLKKNKLSELPESITKLTSLKKLELQKNRLESLPENFGNLISLETLWLDSNRLTSLPESFGSLTSLKDLEISRNRLESLPESITKLISLEELNLRDNRLESLPESLGDLSSLKYLNLESNSIVSIPDSIGDLTNLEYLDLKLNELTSLPKSLEKLKNLKYIDLDNNKIVKK